ncbi:MAG: hypothetical protein ACTSQY_08075 [Candidatus Odinarchaeia archaeon]
MGQEQNEERLTFTDYYYFLFIPMLTILIASLLSLIVHPVTGIITGILPPINIGLIGDIFFAFIFIIIAILSAFIIYLIIEKEKEYILKYLFGFAIAFSTTTIMSLYFMIILGTLITTEIMFQIVFTIIFIISLSIGTVSAYVFTSKRFEKPVKNCFMIFYSIIVSIFLALVLPTWTLIIILVGISIYDIYSVRQGPIKKVIEKSEEKKEFDLNLTVSIGKWEIGIGDLVFYSLLVSHTVIFFGIVPWIFSIIGIIIGLIITLKILIKKKLLPGLPIALFIGVLPILVMTALSVL